jgi:hypothetical protein
MDGWMAGWGDGMVVTDGRKAGNEGGWEGIRKEGQDAMKEERKEEGRGG